jgi:hypothetical protein
MKRQAYGYRDKEFFKLRIMGIHDSRFVLTGLFMMLASLFLWSFPFPKGMVF